MQCQQELDTANGCCRLKMATNGAPAAGRKKQGNSIAQIVLAVCYLFILPLAARPLPCFILLHLLTCHVSCSGTQTTCPVTKRKKEKIASKRELVSLAGDSCSPAKSPQRQQAIMGDHARGLERGRQNNAPSRQRAVLTAQKQWLQLPFGM